MAGNKTPEQLEKEADELFNEVNGIPEGDDKPEDTKLDTEQDKVDDEGGEELQSDDTDKPTETMTPPDDQQDTDDQTVGLTLENAAERIRNAQARMHTATQEASELRRQIQELSGDAMPLKATIERLTGEVAEWKQKAEAAATQQSAANVDSSAGIDNAGLQEAMEDYPEVVGPLLNMVKGLEQKMDSLEGTVTKTQEAAAEQTAQERHFSTIREQHPDFESTIPSDDFRGWLARQTNAIQQIAKNGTADDVNWMLSEYKKAVGVDEEVISNDVDDGLADTSNPSLSRTRQRPSQAKPRYTQAQIKAMSPEEFAKNEKDIDEAMALGLIQ